MLKCTKVWFLQFWEQVKVWWAEPLRRKRFRSSEEVSNEVTQVITRVKNEGVQTGIQDMPKHWTTVIKHNGDYIEGL
jgi:hypothetical protein